MSHSTNIVHLFFKAAEKYPKHIAIIEGEEQVLYAEFKQQIDETSAFFIQKGIKNGDRVLVFIPMSINLYRIVLALFNIGATAVFLDEWVNLKRLDVCCKVAQCQAFVGGFKVKILGFFSSELRKIPIKLGLKYENSGNSFYNLQETRSTDTALITFTTGSTGTPKAAKRTHGFLNEQFQALIEKIEPKPEDIDMPILPIVLMINLGVGCTSVIADFKAGKQDTLNPEKIYRQLIKHHVNRMVSSPFVVKKLAIHCIENKYNILELTKIFTGGAPVFPNEAMIYLKAFPKAQIEIVYGSTEAEPISSINALQFGNETNNTLKSGLNVGLPYRKADVRIITIQHSPIDCKTTHDLTQIMLETGQIGEIIVSGPHVLSEYFNNLEALKLNKIFIGGICWHRTGDSGYLDKEGRLFLTGRCSTLIRRNNRFISPFIYENYFQTLEGVEIGTLLEINGKIIAFIELNRAENKAQILQHLNQLENKPDEIIWLSKIPRDLRHNSKIDYETLKLKLLK